MTIKFNIQIQYRPDNVSLESYFNQKILNSQDKYAKIGYHTLFVLSEFYNFS